MFIGTVLLAAMWGTSLNGWVIMYALSLLIFGIGVGGGYPMTSITAMEGIHGINTSLDDRLHRGRNVLLAFLMQGWGQLINQAVLIILLLIFHAGGNPQSRCTIYLPRFFRLHCNLPSWPSLYSGLQTQERRSILSGEQETIQRHRLRYTFSSSRQSALLTSSPATSLC